VESCDASARALNMLQSDVNADKVKGSALATGIGRFEGTAKVNGKSY
jgi:hypothetical protein